MVAAVKAAPDCVAALIAQMETAIAAFGNESNRFNNNVKSFPAGVRVLKRTNSQRVRLMEETIARRSA